MAFILLKKPVPIDSIYYCEGAVSIHENTKIKDTKNDSGLAMS